MHVAKVAMALAWKKRNPITPNARARAIHIHLGARPPASNRFRNRSTILVMARGKIVIAVMKSIILPSSEVALRQLDQRHPRKGGARLERGGRAPVRMSAMAC